MIDYCIGFQKLCLVFSEPVEHLELNAKMHGFNAGPNFGLDVNSCMID